MATDAIILALSPGAVERRLAQILEFFGLSYESVGPNEDALTPSDSPRVVFASLDAFAVATANSGAAQRIRRAPAVYLYANGSQAESERALRRIAGWEVATLKEAGTGRCVVSVSDDLGELHGPMTGLRVTATPRQEDLVLTAPAVTGGASFTTLLSADGLPAFVRFDWAGVPTYFCTSGAMVDIDQPVAGAFFDVKDYFSSIVPLVMFVRSMFGERAWRPLETGACLIIDDPLLKSTYGFCDFKRLLELMNVHDFTTNVAFIPWNWRRTSSSAAAFFRQQSSRYSVSIHGCDHTAQEFGDTSLDRLDGKARLAQSRMRKHERRTGITHDAVMVFPQGVFSSESLGVLKRHAFVAAVNTEVAPVDHGVARTQIRDVWDVAIMRFATFPIFTRRYAVHGVENFAFDTLLGKPCLIVAHHDFFRDEYAALVQLLQNLSALKCSLTWRSLGDVIRRAGRQRIRGDGGCEVEMYGSELHWVNTSGRPLRVVVRKKEHDPSLIKSVRGRDGDLKWTTSGDVLEFADTVGPGSEAHFSIDYGAPPARAQVHRPISVKASVAARRLLCEFRDQYWQKLVHG